MDSEPQVCKRVQPLPNPEEPINKKLNFPQQTTNQIMYLKPRSCQISNCSLMKMNRIKIKPYQNQKIIIMICYKKKSTKM